MAGNEHIAELGHQWRELLRPWAERYADLTQAISEHVARLSDDDLAGLAEATTKVSQTNVWWATYNVAPLVRDACGMERLSRERKFRG